jgi:hypothetical protein
MITVTLTRRETVVLTRAVELTKDTFAGHLLPGGNELDRAQSKLLDALEAPVLGELLAFPMSPSPSPRRRRRRTGA